MSSRTVLSQDLLERCAQRAGGYDRENRFFMEDFEEVRQTNYLLAAVPQEFGGLGLTHVEVCRERRRVSAVLAINMPLLTTGIAADLWRKGDNSRVTVGGGREWRRLYLRLLGIGQAPRSALFRRESRAGPGRLPAARCFR
jgi:alkylation response protein AidB-like acyl-CoA dehydrogenase